MIVGSFRTRPLLRDPGYLPLSPGPATLQFQLPLIPQMPHCPKRGFQFLSAHKRHLGSFTLQIPALIVQVEEMRLAEVDIVVKQVQPLGGLQPVEVRQLVPEDALVLTGIGGSIQHELVEAKAPGVGDLKRPVLPVPAGGRSLLGNWRDEAFLLKLGQEWIEPTITEPCKGADHIINDLGDKVAVVGHPHKEPQYNEFVHRLLLPASSSLALAR
jgi:hypothetical protein